MDEFLETFCVGVHLRNLFHEVILAVNCLIHQNHLDSVLLEAGRVTVRHGWLGCRLVFDSLLCHVRFQFLLQEKKGFPIFLLFFLLFVL